MDWARPAVLAFDPAVSSHFHVMELVGGNSLVKVKAVRIYASETGEWVLKNTEWRHVDVAYAGKHAYLNGFLHLATTTASGMVVASVDAAGQTWRTTYACVRCEDTRQTRHHWPVAAPPALRGRRCGHGRHLLGRAVGLCSRELQPPLPETSCLPSAWTFAECILSSTQ
jgi:hypothetical protein